MKTVVVYGTCFSVGIVESLVSYMRANISMLPYIMSQGFILQRVTVVSSSTTSSILPRNGSYSMRRQHYLPFPPIHPSRPNAMLCAIPAHFEVALGAAIGPAIRMSPHMARRVPAHAGVEALEVVLVLADLIPTAGTIVSAGRLSLNSHWSWRCSRTCWQSRICEGWPSRSLLQPSKDSWRWSWL